jgi:hypothetical protein
VGNVTEAEWPCVRTAAKRLRAAGFVIDTISGVGLALVSEPEAGNVPRRHRKRRIAGVEFRSVRRADAVRVLAGRVCNRCGAVRGS